MARLNNGKLVRDNIPNQVREQKVLVDERILDSDEFILRLKDKLVEEAREAKEAQSVATLIEELADLQEVIQTLSQAAGVTMQQIEDARIKKRKTKGGFDKRIYLSILDKDKSENPLRKPDCLFCQISAGQHDRKILANFSHCYVIQDAFPVSNGHILIIPHEHTENWFTASPEVRLDMMDALTFMKKKLDVELNPHGYNVGLNCGEVAGQSVMHLHMHLIPRYSGDVGDPRGGVRGVIPSKQKYPY